jgi:methyltransferase (TIGR00027 family)
MKTTRASKTAAQMALSRAIEARRPPAERICSDTVAERLLPRRYRAVLVAPPLRAAGEAVIERLFPGHHHYVLVRTRYLDDFLVEHVRGAEQLVVLGAGFDSRAHRFADRLRGVAVFEVDHPATSSAKRARIARALGGDAAPVTYVPVDFDRDTLAAALERAGYRPGARTIFLWEGVTPYVSQAGVDATLAFIRSSSGPGSRVLFDYVLRAALEGTCELRGARNEVERMKRTDEPFVFGIDADEIAPYLVARGFTAVRDAGADELADRYLHGARARRYVKPWWRIVHAEVARAA